MHHSNSLEQRRAEEELRKNFIAGKGWTEATFPKNFSATFDGVFRDENGKFILLEIYTRQGQLKTGHYRKVCTDILKLITAECFLPHCQKYIVFGSKEAKAFFDKNSWYKQAVEKFNIHLEVGTLSEETKQKLIAAQTRQKQ